MRAALVVACWAALSVPVALVVAAVVRATRGADLAEEVEFYLKGLTARHGGSLRRPLTRVALGTALVALGAALAAPLLEVTDRVYTVAAGTREVFGDGPGPVPAEETAPAPAPERVEPVADPSEPTALAVPPEQTMTAAAAGFSESSRSWWWVAGEDSDEDGADAESAVAADDESTDERADEPDGDGGRSPNDHEDGDEATGTADAPADERHERHERDEADEAPDADDPEAAEPPPAEESDERPPDETTEDLDGDGVPDDEDDDLDGDGIANDEDDDLDGDGIANDEDDDDGEPIEDSSGEGSADSQEQHAP